MPRQRSFRFARGRNLPEDRKLTAWLITYDERSPLCGFAVHELEDWRPCSRDVVFCPTIEAARLHLPRRIDLLHLEGIEAAQLLRDRIPAWGEIRELWF
jgi:hypothetical protein